MTLRPGLTEYVAHCAFPTILLGILPAAPIRPPLWPHRLRVSAASGVIDISEDPEWDEEFGVLGGADDKGEAHRLTEPACDPTPGGFCNRWVGVAPPPGGATK